MPAKFDRCVRKVKRQGKAKNPYAVCNAAMRKTNPEGFVIHAQRGSGPLMFFDGSKVTNNGRPKVFASQAAATFVARALVRDYPVLRPYRVTVEPTRPHGRKRNPDPRVSPAVAEAARRFQAFTGHRANSVERVRVKGGKVALAFGELAGVMYDTVRDGRAEKYIHRFRKKSRPLLAVSSDGTQLHILGGGYEFTEAGIEDR